jgi:hypothetical protein
MGRSSPRGSASSLGHCTASVPWIGSPPSSAAIETLRQETKTAAIPKPGRGGRRIKPPANCDRMRRCETSGGPACLRTSRNWPRLTPKGWHLRRNN